MPRLLCVWSPTWAIDNWRRRFGASPEAAPFALAESVRGVRVLAAVDAAAQAAGLHVGQTLTDAMARVPELVTAEADPAACAAALDALSDWCVRFSPAVALDPPDGLILDVTGVAHLWGGEAALLADLRARLAVNGLNARVAVADTAGAAWALARYGAAPEMVIAPDGQGAALFSLPPAALRLPPEAAAQMERLGLRRIGQLVDLPRGPLARRFGAETLARLDQALGRGREALVFRRPPTPWFVRRAFAEPISAPEDLARVSEDLAAELCARLDREGQGARRFELGFHRLDGRVQAVEAGLAAPGRDPRRLARLIAPKLETVDPGFGVEAATLAAAEVEPLSARQVRLDAWLEAGQEAGLIQLVERLTNRLGPARVWKSAPVQSHVPEQSARPGPALARDLGEGWDPQRPRPLRLFRRPEPLEQVMAPVPDDPPLQFRWRGVLHRVRRAEGPERIGAEWWRGSAEAVQPGAVRTDQVRDYYRVEDEAGQRFWLYRAGLYEPGAAARWWLHGLFG